MARAGQAVGRAVAWLAGAVRVYRRNLRLVVGTAVVIGIPSAAISLAADRLASIDVGDSATSEAAARLVVTLIVLTLGSLGGTVLAGALDTVMEDMATVQLGRRERRPVVRVLAETHFGRLIVADLIVTTLIIVGFILLVVPGVLLIPLLALTGPLITVEDAGPIRAVRRSVALTRRAFGSIALALLVPVMVISALDSLLSQEGIPIGLRVGGTLAVSVLLAPYSALVKVLATHGLRDLEQERSG